MWTPQELSSEALLTHVQLEAELQVTSIIIEHRALQLVACLLS